MIFVDTGAWHAVVDRTDANHTRAVAWLTDNAERLVTTDYVIDETLTLLQARGYAERAIVLGERFFESSDELATVAYLTEQDVRHAWDVFRRYRDKEWSFTDCSSKVAMERLGIAAAFAFDQHFRQFGSLRVVP